MVFPPAPQLTPAPALPESASRELRETDAGALLSRRQTARSRPERDETCKPYCRCDTSAGGDSLSCRLQRGQRTAENSSSLLPPGSGDGVRGRTSAHPG